ncbi:putative signal transducing protein [Vibrio paucivorans]|uniref:DUF2007 domain-containing protein n=1 Tax=Vibrio paucivorans TaxID=2829489 RepID=A0A9X3HST4_9VIBR|nr:DUF2007 domain-containing protein [Vibrio paucivorans]MCW8335066.1 DUF2007 domain-containing protein [Vibrio paucivorans]
MNIFTASNPVQAHILCELLRAENIPCEVRGEGLFGLQGELPFGEDSAPYVWLLEAEQLSKAKSIVDGFHNKEASSYATWVCNSCQEDNEGQFGACWKCGSPQAEKVGNK